MSKISAGKGDACCVCGKSIRRNDKYRCTLTVHRGIEEKLGSTQFLWAHGPCLVKVIPVAEYSFPELD